jgi:tetracycline repressor-like protein
VADDREAFLLLFGSGARRDEEFADEVRRVEDAIAAAIAPLIQADIDADHQQALAYALVGLAEGTSRHLVQLGEAFDPDRLAQQVTDLAWAGLRGVKRV